MKRLFCWIFVLVMLASAALSQQIRKPLLLAHYMPWFQADAKAGTWGWHWTMNHFDPKKTLDGEPQIASHYHPLIGPYDADDPAVVSYEVMLMKLSGIDGVLIDWYGTDDLFDYAANQQRTLRIIAEIKKAHMKFAIVYEDSTVANLIKANKFSAADAVQHVNAMFRWMDKTWFHDPSYVKIDGKPLLLDFGPQYFQHGEWPALFKGVEPKPAFFSEMQPREGAIGGFLWPTPQAGEEGDARKVDEFYHTAPQWPSFVAAAYPQFDDIYAQAGVGPSYGHISDHHHQLYGQLLERAIRSGAKVVQLVTWNDWGEGTQIEPSKELGFQDLITTQTLSKDLIDPSFHATQADLELVQRWYQLHSQPRMAAVPGLVYAGKTREAARIVNGRPGR